MFLVKPACVKLSSGSKRKGVFFGRKLDESSDSEPVERGPPSDARARRTGGHCFRAFGTGPRRDVNEQVDSLGKRIFSKWPVTSAPDDENERAGFSSGENPAHSNRARHV